MTKEEMCFDLSEDYAHKASRGEGDYDIAFTQYMNRCLTRQHNIVETQWYLEFNLEPFKKVVNFI